MLVSSEIELRITLISYLLTWIFISLRNLEVDVDIYIYYVKHEFYLEHVYDYLKQEVDSLK